MVSPVIQFRSTTTLAPLDVKTLVEELKGFLETCRLTAASDTYLKYHPRLQQVIEKL